MKNTIKSFGLIALFFIIFISCSKENDVEKITDISGTRWGLAYLKFGYENDITEYNTTEELKQIDEYDELEFISDGRVYHTFGENIYIENWKQEGNKIIITAEDELELTLTSNKLIYSKNQNGYIEEFYYTRK